MNLIQTADNSNFVNASYIISITRETGLNDSYWVVTDINNKAYRISDYTLKKLLEWPSSYVYWSDEKCKFIEGKS